MCVCGLHSDLAWFLVIKLLSNSEKFLSFVMAFSVCSLTVLQNQPFFCTNLLHGLNSILGMGTLEFHICRIQNQAIPNPNLAALSRALEQAQI